jgi:hypothetical protein
VVGQIRQQFARVQIGCNGSLWHRYFERFTAPAVLVLALAVHTVFCPPVRVIAKGKQRGNVAVSDEPDIATLAAIATVRSTECLRAFASERRTAGSTIAAAYIQLRFIDEPAHRTP